MEDPMFSHDEDLARMMLSSDLLIKACTAICDTPVRIDEQDPFSISIQVSKDLVSNGKIIAFRSSPGSTVHNLQELKDVKALVSSTEPVIDFLSPKFNPHISINKVAVDVFSSLFENLLSVLHDQIDISKPLIVTGNSLGGSIASLFTIWVLDTIYLTKSERPICITFGAPLLGDIYFRKAIYAHSSWPSCFVHVAFTKDPIPQFFTSLDYEPFGLFFLCSDLGCVCMDHPEFVLKVMDAMKSVRDTHFSVIQIEFYRQLLVNLKRNATYKKNSILGEADIDSLQIGIVLQLEAIGVIRKQEKVRNEDLIGKMKKTKKSDILHERNMADEKKKLNKTKIIMINLEWYKKATIDDGGYYDGYKSPDSFDKTKSRDKIIKDKSMLEIYWETMTEKAKEKPQKEAVSFRKSWLYAGTNYRRMVEPLHIAEHYKSGKTDYVRTARPKHFILLEKWFNDDNKPEIHTTPASLTEDSCFWARVEEAIISLDVLMNIQSLDVEKDPPIIKLNDFEDYVKRLIEGCAVSPEIFLPKSTFMKWWGKYKQYKDGTTTGGLYTSPLATFMMNGRQHYV